MADCGDVVVNEFETTEPTFCVYKTGGVPDNLQVQCMCIPSR